MGAGEQIGRWRIAQDEWGSWEVTDGYLSSLRITEAEARAWALELDAMDRRGETFYDVLKRAREQWLRDHPPALE